MSWIHTHVILPLAESERHTGLAARLRAIRRFERLPEQAQREEQQQRLRRILEHAYSTVPFYRQRFDQAGFRPSQARTDTPLAFPVLTRNDLRTRTGDLLSNAYSPNHLLRSVTGGTTSTPVGFHRDLEALRDKTALHLRLNSSTGYNAGDSVLMLWGAHNDLVINPSLRRKIYEEKIMRRVPAPSGMISEEILERFRLRYEQQKPKVIYAYASTLVTFATYLEQRGFRHRPQVIIATAEPLNEQKREFVESVLGQPVYDHYGSRDVGMIATQCAAHDLLHFHPWGCHIEFDPIGDTPEGPAYRLLVTDLLNHGQPFLRYDTGDCVTLSQQRCSCGSWVPSIRKVLGRITDGIVLTGGNIVPGTAIVAKMQSLSDKYPSVAQVQFVQKTHEHIHLRYALAPGISSAPQEIETICAGIDALVNQGMHWTLEQVPEIPREASGKIRLSRSEVPSAAHVFEQPV